MQLPTMAFFLFHVRLIFFIYGANEKLAFYFIGQSDIDLLTYCHQITINGNVRSERNGRN